MLNGRKRGRINEKGRISAAGRGGCKNVRVAYGQVGKKEKKNFGVVKVRERSSKVPCNP